MKLHDFNCPSEGPAATGVMSAGGAYCHEGDGQGCF